MLAPYAALLLFLLPPLYPVFLLLHVLSIYSRLFFLLLANPRANLLFGCLAPWAFMCFCLDDQWEHGALFAVLISATPGLKKKGRAGSRPLKTIDPLTVERAVREQGVEFCFSSFFLMCLFVCLLLPLAVYSSGSFGGCMVRTGWLDERNT